MNKWDDYYKEMLSQKQDIEDIRKSNLENWLIEHPIDKNNIDVELIKREFLNVQEKRVVIVGNEDNLNLFGTYIIKKDLTINYDEILYFDLTWLINNFYSNESSKEVLRLKNSIYSGEYKYFLIKNFPLKLGGLIEKVKNTVFDMLEDVLLSSQDLKFVISYQGEKEDALVQASILRKKIGMSIEDLKVEKKEEKTTRKRKTNPSLKFKKA